MAVLNVTPDSFSDGGRTLDPRAALDHALALEAQGADLLDVGGQSTRPNAPSVPVEEELRRVGPVLQALAGRLRIPLSIDTSRAPVARLALDQGASVVNDVTAGREDPRLLPLVAERRAGLVLMHMRGTPADMQRDPRYADVTAEVAALLRERLELALELGIERTRIWLDPGIGFGKTLEHNLTLLEELGLLRSLGQDVLVGPSRKSFIGAVARAFGREEHGAPIRAGGTAAAVAACVNAGAAWLRVHDAAPMADAARVAWSIAEAAR
jgi:dihydropteroate synthase